MKKGKIVFLCGVTSSGKTSIVDAIQNISEEFYYVVANDLMVQMVGDKYLNKDYWKYESKAIYYMYHMAKLLSDFGENVLIDGCLLETPELPDHYEKVKKIFEGNPFYLIEVYCPLEICRLRNLERDDRSENQSYEQHLLWTKNVEYDLTVDTSRLSSDDGAKMILQWINEHSD
jgi:adenylylsulfate kinase/chloramphenicol 3-O phosphotransferase